MISKEEIEKLAQLARLEVSSGEIESLQKDISNILDYIGQVSAVSAGEVKEVGVIHNVMRDDLPRTENDTLADKEKALVSAFPKSEKGYNVVRKIIQKDE
jgi:aspartyl-tRNA(Asn)/glutamyl-tRNA(Gln) amidotransferase subunit C